jgi:hypothetical protein
MMDEENTTKEDIARLALKLSRPWIDGGVTATEWCEAVDIIFAVAGKTLLRAPSAAPSIDPHKPANGGFKPKGVA